ncbi:MAG: radical SAM protein [Clostridia bacterium]|nr:radical SAM protein [Clostridia bacterium]
MYFLNRYSIITDKNPREIVLLRGSGCRWRRCTFCDYHTDSSPDEAANFALNRTVLEQITGEYGRLEVINSGSFVDLDGCTVDLLTQICQRRSIHTLHIECHWMHRDALAPFRERFAAVGTDVIFKIGVETFDADFRERILRKGIGRISAAEIAAAGFGEVNLLCGLAGQTAASMTADIECGLAHFSRVCVNLMVENTTPIKPDPEEVRAFLEEVVPRYKDDLRVDILVENTDFGVWE